MPPRELPEGPPVAGAPYWYWLGGRPALDFVNTRRERWRRDVECLPSVDEVVEWLVRPPALARPVGGLATRAARRPDGSARARRAAGRGLAATRARHGGARRRADAGAPGRT